MHGKLDSRSLTYVRTTDHTPDDRRCDDARNHAMAIIIIIIFVGISTTDAYTVRKIFLAQDGKKNKKIFQLLKKYNYRSSSIDPRLVSCVRLTGPFDGSLS